MSRKVFFLSAGLIVLSFLLCLKQPYSIVSDAGYQALSALQFARNEVTSVNSLRLVNPADLSRAAECPLLLWAPFAAWAFLGGLKAGLSPGDAARILSLLACLAGGLGWAWIALMLRLKGWRGVLAVAFASLYCVRVHLTLSMGTADEFVYAVAPWLLGAAIALAGRSRVRVTGRLILGTALLSLACGAVYWLKYSGIVMGLAIVAGVALAQLRSGARLRPRVLFLAFVLYGCAFALPPAALRSVNYRRSGSDLMDMSAKRNRPRDFTMIRSFVAEETFHAGAVLFTPSPGIRRLAEGRGEALEWLLRTPGLLLLGMVVWLSFRYLPPHLRDFAPLLTVVPLLAFPALSVLGRTRYTSALERACLPSWIFLELAFFLLIGGAPAEESMPGPKTRRLLAGLAGLQILFFSWTPISTAREVRQRTRQPAYQMTANALYDPDLSRSSSHAAVNRIRSVLRGPQDVIVPATYSDRAFGTDTWIELDGLGRLLPLNTGPFALSRTQGEGGSYLARTPFRTSGPVRVILIAADPYHRSDFHASVERIKSRFVQAKQWTQSPPEAGDSFEIWIAALEEDGIAQGVERASATGSQSTGVAAFAPPR